MDTSEKLAWVPSVDDVRALFLYDFQTGVLTRRGCITNPLSNRGNNPHRIGLVCTTPTTGGYLVTSIRKKLYVAHRLIWF